MERERTSIETLGVDFLVHKVVPIKERVIDRFTLILNDLEAVNIDEEMKGGLTLKSFEMDKIEKSRFLLSYDLDSNNFLLIYRYDAFSKRVKKLDEKINLMSSDYRIEANWDHRSGSYCTNIGVYALSKIDSKSTHISSNPYKFFEKHLDTIMDVFLRNC